MTTTPDGHEWASFEDPDEDRTWLFDVTFLESSWTCIYGAGCQGVFTKEAPELEQGCCSYGAHFTGEDDLARVEQAAKALSREVFQFYDKARRGGIARRKGGEITTRLVDDACIFLNRPGFSGGSGCALHLGALLEDVAPLSKKPDVCWQLPLRREDLTDSHGHVTSVISEWQRRHWGEAGHEFAWWCTEAAEAFVATSPVYARLSDELEALVGARVFEQLRHYLDQRRLRPVRLQHPAVRKRTATKA